MGRPYFQNLSPSPHRTTNRGREGQNEDRSPSSVKRPRFVLVEDILRDEVSPPSSFRHLARLFYPDVEDDESDSGAHDEEVEDDDVEDAESDSGTHDDDDDDDDDDVVESSAESAASDESSASSPEESDESNASPTESTGSSRTRDSESNPEDCPEAKIEDEAEEEITDEMVISYFLTPIQGNSRGTTTTNENNTSEREKH